MCVRLRVATAAIRAGLHRPMADIAAPRVTAAHAAEFPATAGHAAHLATVVAARPAEAGIIQRLAEVDITPVAAVEDTHPVAEAAGIPVVAAAIPVAEDIAVVIARTSLKRIAKKLGDAKSPREAAT